MPADGVHAEYAAAEAAGAFLLPIGATGGAARSIAEGLVGSPLLIKGLEARRPSDDELKTLLNEKDPNKLASLTVAILKRIAAGFG
jgi:hypothetical protein